MAKLNPPASGQVDYYDAGMPGLVLRVNYGGAKVWRALYYLKKFDKDGKRITVPTTHKLGRYPHMRLKQAREHARQFLEDPQKALAQADEGSFKEVAENFIKRHVEHEKLRSQPEIERVLKKYIYPKWEARPFREIRRSDVTTLLDQIEDNHGARQADVCLAVIRKMMNWYASRDDYYVSPVVKGMHRNKGDDRKRKRILTDDEIRALWKAADGTFGAFLKVALLTAQRRDKVVTMSWDDVVDGVWTIQREEREKSNAGSLQLPKAVIDIIEDQPRIAGNPYRVRGRQGQRSVQQLQPTQEGTGDAADAGSIAQSCRATEIRRCCPSLQRSGSCSKSLPPRRATRGKRSRTNSADMADGARSKSTDRAHANEPRGVLPDTTERVLGHHRRRRSRL